jgi:putative redox protein
MSEQLQVTFPGGKRVDVSAAGFTIMTDQPPKHGGEGSAPQPFLLFLASIASCSGIYALNFCHSRDIPTEGLGLSMDWEYDGKSPADAVVRLILTLPAGFPERYRDGIVKAMSLCAVKKHIAEAPRFEVRLEG